MRNGRNEFVPKRGTGAGDRSARSETKAAVEVLMHVSSATLAGGCEPPRNAAVSGDRRVEPDPCPATTPFPAWKTPTIQDPPRVRLSALGRMATIVCSRLSSTRKLRNPAHNRGAPVVLGRSIPVRMLHGMRAPVTPVVFRCPEPGASGLARRSGNGPRLPVAEWNGTACAGVALG